VLTVYRPPQACGAFELCAQLAEPHASAGGNGINAKIFSSGTQYLSSLLVGELWLSLCDDFVNYEPWNLAG
jgi:hypothetical protein